MPQLEPKKSPETAYEVPILRTFVATIVIMVISEFLIMMVLQQYMQFLSSRAIALLDAFLLTAILLPTLYSLFLSPLLRQLTIRRETEKQLSQNEELFKLGEEALRNIAEGVSAATGAAFFQSLVQYLATTLEVDFALIGELTDDSMERIETNAIFACGAMAENITYDLADTPCENVVGRELAIYPEGVQRQFPRDSLLVEMGVESYIGAPLFASTGLPLGIIVIMGRRPIEDTKLAVAMLRIFAARAAAELERKRSEHELQAAYSKLQERKAYVESVVANIQSGIIVTDNELCIKLANAYAVNVFGRHDGELIGRNLAEVCPGISDSMASGVNSAEISIRPDILVGFKRFDLKGGEGAVNGHIVTFVDLSEIIKIRREMRSRERLATIGEVVAKVAHEMRNPLFGITAVAQILGMEIELSPAQKELMDSLFTEARRLNRLVEELLDCSKDLKLNRQTFGLLRTINESVAISDVFIGEKGIRVTRSMPGAEILLHGDQERIKQVMLNIIKNAVDATPHGGGIELAVEPGTTGVEIRVSDGGPGIRDDEMERIFDVFYTTKKHGTGLGLPISRKIVEAHGGMLSATNNADGGACFIITLPNTG